MTVHRIDTGRILERSWIAEIEYYATIGSTNDRAKECAAAATQKLPLLVVADEQTAGRGRGGNRWWTGQGGLALSLLLDVEEIGLRRAQSPLIALAAAVAVVETVSAVAPGVRPGVHWPNDVYAGDRKLAGILVELPSSHRSVVGIGINANNSLDHAPPEIVETATTLRDLTGSHHDPTELLLALLDALGRKLPQLRTEPEAIAECANALCLQRDRLLNVNVGGVLLCGRCRGIAPDGALVLETAEGTKQIYSGVLRRSEYGPVGR